MQERIGTPGSGSPRLRWSAWLTLAQLLFLLHAPLVPVVPDLLPPGVDHATGSCTRTTGSSSCCDTGPEDSGPCEHARASSIDVPASGQETDLPSLTAESDRDVLPRSSPLDGPVLLGARPDEVAVGPRPGVPELDPPPPRHVFLA